MSVKKKKKIATTFILLILDIVVVLVCYKMFKTSPADFEPERPIISDEISPYITHNIAETIYNGVWSGKEFELLLTDEGVNDILARQDWPIEVEDMTIESACVKIKPGLVRVMGKVDCKYFDTVVTADSWAELDENTNMTLKLGQVKAGNFPIRFVVFPLLKKNLEEDIENYEADSIERKVAESFFEAKAFEPVIDLGVGGRKIKILGIELLEGMAKIRLLPMK